METERTMTAGSKKGEIFEVREVSQESRVEALKTRPEVQVGASRRGDQTL
jgi:hypothetical protein